MLKRVSIFITGIAAITFLSLMFYSPIYASTGSEQPVFIVDIENTTTPDASVSEEEETISGWIHGNTTYIDKNSQAATGWQKQDGQWYYLDRYTGNYTGWMDEGEHRYLLNEDGALHTGWYEEGGDRYYLTLAGMATGWSKVDGEWYHFQQDGKMTESGWHIIDGRAEFFKPEWVDYRLSVISLEYVTPEGFLPPDMIDIESIRTTNAYTLGSWGKSANREAAIALDEMLASAADEGISDFFINSAYRSREIQAGLYKRNTGRQPDYSIPSGAIATMPPGASEHEGGLTFDIMTNSMRSVTQAISNTAQGEWLSANAHRYGFVMRYTQDKEAITHIIHEPWHFRYVGKEAAAEMYENNLCLEEYIGLAE